MEPIIIEGTSKTPTVKFDSNEGVFEIKGRSIPENSVEFYKPLVDWLDAYKDGLLISGSNISIQVPQNAFWMYSRSLRRSIRQRMKWK
jgi:hypothetical protein